MKNLKYLALITQVGLDMITTILFGCFIGYLLDKLFKIDNNIFFTIFMILGVIAGFYGLFKNLSKIIEKKESIKKDGDLDE